MKKGIFLSRLAGFTISLVGIGVAILQMLVVQGETSLEKIASALKIIFELPVLSAVILALINGPLIASILFKRYSIERGKSIWAGIIGALVSLSSMVLIAHAVNLIQSGADADWLGALLFYWVFTMIGAGIPAIVLGAIQGFWIYRIRLKVPAE